MKKKEMCEMNNKNVKSRSYKSRIMFFLIALLTCFVMLWGTNLLSNDAFSQYSDKAMESMQDKESVAVKILNDKNLKEASPEKVIGAIKQIGDIAGLRIGKGPYTISSPDTIKAVANYLDFKKNKPQSESSKKMANVDIISGFHEIGPSEIYPAIKTLIDIREPALPVMVEVIKNEESLSLKSQNALYVISHYYRGDLKKGIDYLRQQTADAKTSESNQRLFFAIDELSKKLQKRK